MERGEGLMLQTRPQADTVDLQRLPVGEGVWAAASSGPWLPLLREGQAGLALTVTRQVERQEE